MEPDAAEMRVLGCLIEKQRTTPDAYPLTLNSLRLACNQSTNREPVVDYDESTIRAALDRLGRRRWSRLASWSSSRAMKYRHLFDETLGLSGAELALLCVLMLRGPQTSGELKQRGERLHRFEGDAVERTLDGLAERELVESLGRQPGQREQRYAHRLAGADDTAPAARPPGEALPEPPATEPPAPEPPAPEPPSPELDGLEARVARLEAGVAALRDELGSLRSGIGT